MKFSIRDLLLVTVIVALAAGWWVDRWGLVRKYDDDMGDIVVALMRTDYFIVHGKDGRLRLMKKSEWPITSAGD